mgnify:FL=1|tara:strand:+ start:481 stop:726 length:246 start_codon:yes stop_codon:yes gene_type:complete
MEQKAGKFFVGDVVEYIPGPGLIAPSSSSLGFITDVKDDFYIKVHWYIVNILPTSRGEEEWIAAGILSQIGKLKVVSKKDE